MNMFLFGLTIGALVMFLAYRVCAQRRQLDQCETCQALNSFCDELQRDNAELSAASRFTLHASRVKIDIDAIVAIESSGNAAAVGDGGRSVGLCQMSRAAWQDTAKHCGFEGYDYDRDAWDPGINRMFANGYINRVIPERYFRAYNLPDTEPMRLAAYCWGIGNVRRQYKADGGIHNFPPAVIEYIQKYRAAKEDQRSKGKGQI